ncbi:hypothetical protein [Streptomyces acidiscabies]
MPETYFHVRRPDGQIERTAAAYRAHSGAKVTVESLTDAGGSPR